jgi:hypothetical protein
MCIAIVVGGGTGDNADGFQKCKAAAYRCFAYFTVALCTSWTAGGRRQHWFPLLETIEQEGSAGGPRTATYD